MNRIGYFSGNTCARLFPGMHSTLVHKNSEVSAFLNHRMIYCQVCESRPEYLWGINVDANLFWNEETTYFLIC